jgi:hypothetical protein
MQMKARAHSVGGCTDIYQTIGQCTKLCMHPLKVLPDMGRRHSHQSDSSGHGWLHNNTALTQREVRVWHGRHTEERCVELDSMLIAEVVLEILSSQVICHTSQSNSHRMVQQDWMVHALLWRGRVIVQRRKHTWNAGSHVSTQGYTETSWDKTQMNKMTHPLRCTELPTS